jgi:hypothetical protein
LFDQVIDSRTCLDQHHEDTWRLEGSDQLGDRVTADEVFPVGSPCHQLIDFVDTPIEDSDPIPTTFHVERQILAHHRQPDQPKVAIAAHL